MNNKIIIYSLLFIISPAISSENQRSQKKAEECILLRKYNSSHIYLQHNGYSLPIIPYTVLGIDQDCITLKYNAQEGLGAIYIPDPEKVLKRVIISKEAYASIARWQLSATPIGTLTHNEKYKLNPPFFVAVKEDTFYQLYPISHIDLTKPRKLDVAVSKLWIDCNHETNHAAQLKSDRNFIVAMALGISIGGIIVALATLCAVHGIVESFHHTKSVCITRPIK